MKISIENFVCESASASVRLRNGIRRAASAGDLPFETVEEYLAAGVHGMDRMLRLKDLGQKSIAELNSLIQEALAQKTSSTSEANASVSFDPNIPLLDFLAQQATASVRLRNSILSAVNDGSCPFKTVSEYLQFGPARMVEIRKISSLGVGTALEFEALVQATIARGPDAPETSISPEFDIPLLDFLAQQATASVRLRNSILSAVNDGTCPFKTVSEYIQFGTARVVAIRKIPSLGFGTAQEFEALVQNALADGSAVPNSSRIRLNKDGFPDLESLVDTVFAALDSKQLDIMLDRIKSKHTLEVVARSFGITRERVRQIEAGAVQKLTRGYSGLIKDAVQAIYQKLLEINLMQCSVQNFATLLTCDVTTAEIFFGLVKKLDPELLKIVVIRDKHVLLPTHFLPPAAWNVSIRNAMLTEQLPLNLRSLLNSLSTVPQFYVLNYLRDRHSAEITELEFTSRPKLSVADMCISVLRKSGTSLHISDIRAAIFRYFEEDIPEHSVNATVGRLKSCLIVAPGRYSLYENIPYSSDQLSEITQHVYQYLFDKNIFLSSKILFDRLFEPDKNAFPNGFNHYLMMGIVQDDDRFITKRGNMVGLRSFDLTEAYISLEDEVRTLVLENGPIAIPAIIEKLSETRKLCNDSGIRLILAQTPEVIRVGPRTYGSLHHFFETRQEYEDLLLAIKVNLLGARKSLFALTEELTRLRFPRVSSEVVESLLTSIDQAIKEGNAYRLVTDDEELALYREMASACLKAGEGQEELSQRLSANMPTDRALKLIQFDSRFLVEEKTHDAATENSELISIIDEFNF